MTCKVSAYNIWRTLSKLEEDLDRAKERLLREGFVEQAADVTWSHIMLRRAVSSFRFNKKPLRNSENA